MSAADLTRLTGISSGRISKLSQGRGELRLPEALRAARAVGVTLDYLADASADEPEPAPSEAERACLAAVRAMGPEEALRRLLQTRRPPVIEPDVSAPAPAPKSETPPPPSRHDRERRGAG